MKLKLQRTAQINNTVLGELFINDKFFCYTLEDKIRDVKIKHETCISEGTYKIILNYSQRFKTILPLLLDVPNFEGVRIHPGNTIHDTSGCLLVGSAIKGETILHSKTTFFKLFEKLKLAFKKEEIEIEILNPSKPVIAEILITEKPLLETVIPETIEIIPTIISQTELSNIKTNTHNLINLITDLIKWLIKSF